MAKSLKLTPDPQQVCCMCHTCVGSAPKHVRRLHNGEIAEISCINSKFLREIVFPAQKNIPGIPTLSANHEPEELVEIFLSSIAHHPLALTQKVIKEVGSFCQQVLGTNIKPDFIKG
jgi:hypothetical protein